MVKRNGAHLDEGVRSNARKRARTQLNFAGSNSARQTASLRIRQPVHLRNAVPVRVPASVAVPAPHASNSVGVQGDAAGRAQRGGTSSISASISHTCADDVSDEKGSSKSDSRVRHDRGHNERPGPSDSLDLGSTSGTTATTGTTSYQPDESEAEASDAHDIDNYSIEDLGGREQWRRALTQQRREERGRQQVEELLDQRGLPFPHQKPPRLRLRAGDTNPKEALRQLAVNQPASVLIALRTFRFVAADERMLAATVEAAVAPPVKPRHARFEGTTNVKQVVPATASMRAGTSAKAAAGPSMTPSAAATAGAPAAFINSNSNGESKAGTSREADGSTDYSSETEADCNGGSNVASWDAADGQCRALALKLISMQKLAEAGARILDPQSVAATAMLAGGYARASPPTDRYRRARSQAVAAIRSQRLREQLESADLTTWLQGQAASFLQECLADTDPVDLPATAKQLLQLLRVVLMEDGADEEVEEWDAAAGAPPAMVMEMAPSAGAAPPAATAAHDALEGLASQDDRQVPCNITEVLSRLAREGWCWNRNLCNDRSPVQPAAEVVPAEATSPEAPAAGVAVVAQQRCQPLLQQLVNLLTQRLVRTLWSHPSFDGARRARALTAIAEELGWKEMSAPAIPVTTESLHRDSFVAAYYRRLLTRAKGRPRYQLSKWRTAEMLLMRTVMVPKFWRKALYYVNALHDLAWRARRAFPMGLLLRGPSLKLVRSAQAPRSRLMGSEGEDGHGGPKGEQIASRDRSEGANYVWRVEATKTLKEVSGFLMDGREYMPVLSAAVTDGGSDGATSLASRTFATAGGAMLTAGRWSPNHQLPPQVWASALPIAALTARPADLDGVSGLPAAPPLRVCRTPEAAAEAIDLTLVALEGPLAAVAVAAELGSQDWGLGRGLGGLHREINLGVGWYGRDLELLLPARGSALASRLAAIRHSLVPVRATAAAALFAPSHPDMGTLRVRFGCGDCATCRDPLAEHPCLRPLLVMASYTSVREVRSSTLQESAAAALRTSLGWDPVATYRAAAAAAAGHFMNGSSGSDGVRVGSAGTASCFAVGEDDRLAAEQEQSGEERARKRSRRVAALPSCSSPSLAAAQGVLPTGPCGGTAAAERDADPDPGGVASGASSLDDMPLRERSRMLRYGARRSSLRRQRQRRGRGWEHGGDLVGPAGAPSVGEVKMREEVEALAQMARRQKNYSWQAIQADRRLKVGPHDGSVIAPAVSRGSSLEALDGLCLDAEVVGRRNVLAWIINAARAADLRQERARVVRWACKKMPRWVPFFSPWQVKVRPGLVPHGMQGLLFATHAPAAAAASSYHVLGSTLPAGPEDRPVLLRPDKAGRIEAPVAVVRAAAAARAAGHDVVPLSPAYQLPGSLDAASCRWCGSLTHTSCLACPLRRLCAPSLSLLPARCKTGGSVLVADMAATRAASEGAYGGVAAPRGPAAAAAAKAPQAPLRDPAGTPRSVPLLALPADPLPQRQLLPQGRPQPRACHHYSTLLGGGEVEPQIWKRLQPVQLCPAKRRRGAEAEPGGAKAVEAESDIEWEAPQENGDRGTTVKRNLIALAMQEKGAAGLGPVGKLPPAEGDSLPAWLATLEPHTLELMAALDAAHQLSNGLQPVRRIVARQADSPADPALVDVGAAWQRTAWQAQPAPEPLSFDVLLMLALLAEESARADMEAQADAEARAKEEERRRAVAALEARRRNIAAGAVVKHQQRKSTKKKEGWREGKGRTSWGWK